MTTIYVDDYTYPCQTLISLINIFSLDINIKNISEYERNHYRVPVIEYFRKNIVYSDFQDLISKLSKIHKKEITLDSIFDKIKNSLYTNYYSQETIRNLLKEKSIRHHIKDGYQLIHHIVICNNHNLFKYYAYKYGFELKETLTIAFADADGNRVIGNQNVMHTAKIKNKEMFKYYSYMPFLKLKDNNDKNPDDY